MTNKIELDLTDFYRFVSQNPEFHSPYNRNYKRLSETWSGYINKHDFSNVNPLDLGPLGSIQILPTVLGKVAISDLFYIGELVIFLYYLLNKNKYKNALDLGANIGVHSIIMSNLGWDVQAFEPSRKNYEDLTRNLQINDVNNVRSYQLAISNYAGTADFVDLEDNRTGNHIINKKLDVYGVHEKYTVPVENISAVVKNVDLIKMDIEGSEADCILGLNFEDFEKFDIFCEISSSLIAEKIFTHSKKMSLNLFSQKIGWKKVTSLSDMPSHWSDGNLFISRKNSMGWPNAN